MMTHAKNKLDAIMEVMPHIAWTITVDAEADYFNQRWYEYTGLNFEQTKGYGWQQVIHPDDLQHAMDSCLAIRESGIASDIELRYKRADGLYRWHLTRLQPIIDDDGGISFWVGTSTDIDELKQLQMQKDDFIAMASHELRAPLTSLSLSLQMLQEVAHNKRGMPADVPLYTTRAMGSLKKLVGLLDNLVDITRLQRGQRDINKKWIDLAALVYECCGQAHLPETHQILKKGDKVLMVYADPARIEQVLINLLNNAVKYSPSANMVEVAISHDKENARIAVTDYGIGIVPDKIPQLFDRYYRAENSMLQFAGLGLGLYISSEIVHQHNGTIGVDSEPGKGSTFWFTLPLNN